MWFKRNKKSINPTEIKKVRYTVKPYSTKIILAWIKSLEGNKEITLWLQQNGYAEIPIFNQAIYLKKEARAWLMNNDFPHLMAFINAMEGDQKALLWLEKLNLFDYKYMALAIDGESEGWEWLNKNNLPELFALSQVLKSIKDKIEDRHNDAHSFGSE
jgi:hypothetical protein